RQSLFLLTSSRGFDCSRGYHRRWLPDCPSWNSQARCPERPRGEPRRGFGEYRPASYRLAQGRSGGRDAPPPSPPPPPRPKMPTLAMPIRARFIIDLPLDNEGENGQHPHAANVPVT